MLKVCMLLCLLALVISEKQEEMTDKGKKGQSGVNGLHSINPTPKWPFEKYIRFNPPFTATPSFVYGLSVLDFAHTRNVRAVATIKSLTRTWVLLHLNKWADTFMYGLKISWMACPK